MSRRDLFHVSKWTSTVHEEQRECVCVCETYQIGLMSVSWGAGLPETERSVRIHDPKLQHAHTHTRELVYTHYSLTHTNWFLTVRTHLISLVIEAYLGDPGVSGAPEAGDLLWVTPFKHAYAAVLSSGQIYTHTHIENVLSENITKWHLNQFIQTKYVSETEESDKKTCFSLSEL